MKQKTLVIGRKNGEVQIGEVTGYGSTSLRVIFPQDVWVKVLSGNATSVWDHQEMSGFKKVYLEGDCVLSISGQQFQCVAGSSIEPMENLNQSAA